MNRLVVFWLALGVLIGADVLGSVVTTSVWNNIAKALAPVSKSYAGIGGTGALIATHIALLAVLTVGAATLNADRNDGRTGRIYPWPVCFGIAAHSNIPCLLLLDEPG